MPRKPLQVGTWGKIHRVDLGGGVHAAKGRFRDVDGVTRLIEARGKTGAAAERALIAAMKDRAAISGTDITSLTRLAALADYWLRTEIETSDRSTSTKDRYRYVVETYVIPGVGGLTVREATVAAVDRYLKHEQERTGGATAKLCRTVLSGMMGIAVRHNAAAANPVRDVARIKVESKAVRALSLDEVADLRADLQADAKAAAVDLPDIVAVLLGTGGRVGSVLAIPWPEVELEAGLLSLTGTIVRVKGVGLQRQERTKTGKVQRLRLPTFTLDVLRERWEQGPDGGPLDLVFPSTTGGPREVTTVDRQWRGFRERHPGKWDWVTPHTFRKTVATLLATEDDIETARVQLGHGTKMITERHYVQEPAIGPDTTELLQRFAGESVG